MAKRKKKVNRISMNMGKKENPLRKFLDETLMTLHRFSQNTGLPHSTLYRIYIGQRMPKRTLANKLVKATKGKLKLEDFGYE